MSACDTCWRLITASWRSTMILHTRWAVGVIGAVRHQALKRTSHGRGGSLVELDIGAYAAISCFCVGTRTPCTFGWGRSALL